MAMFSNVLLLCLAVLSVGQSFILDGPEDDSMQLEDGPVPLETDYDEPIEEMEDHDDDIDYHPDFPMARSASDARASKQLQQEDIANVRSPRLPISRPVIDVPSHNSATRDLHRSDYDTRYNPYDDYQSGGYSSYPSYGYREPITYGYNLYPNFYSGGYNGGYHRSPRSHGYGHRISYGRNAHGNSYGGHGRSYGGSYGGYGSHGGYGSYGSHGGYRRGGYGRPAYSRYGYSGYGSNLGRYGNSYRY